MIRYIKTKSLFDLCELGRRKFKKNTEIPNTSTTSIACKRRKKIPGLFGDNEVWVKKEEKVEKLIWDFYNSLLKLAIIPNIARTAEGYQGQSHAT